MVDTTWYTTLRTGLLSWPHPALLVTHGATSRLDRPHLSVLHVLSPVSCMCYAQCPACHVLCTVSCRCYACAARRAKSYSTLTLTITITLTLNAGNERRTPVPVSSVVRVGVMSFLSQSDADSIISATLHRYIEHRVGGL